MGNRTIQTTQAMRPQYWRGRNWARGLAALGVVAGVVTGTWAVEEAAKSAAPGLKGILSNAAPAALTAEEFAKLDGNWTEWSQGAAAAVADFYAKLDSLDAKAELSQHALRRSAIEGADQDEIGIERNGGFGLPRQPPKGAGLVGHGR